MRLRGRDYPVLLPSLRDPRLHVAAVLLTLQVLGQTVLDFRLSIAQILVCLAVGALIEFGVAFFKDKVILWPASGLLTGNSTAFILRVPGTLHGQWWSLHGIWIFIGVVAVSMASKYLIRWRGRHIFNPSNLGLVLAFVALGPAVHRAAGPVVDPDGPVDDRDLRHPDRRRPPHRVGAEAARPRARLHGGVCAVRRAGARCRCRTTA